MNDKFDEFQKQYPNLFKEYPRSGFYLNPGWETLVHTLCSILEHQIKLLPEDLRGNFYCAQVKEKFGGLRFYMTASANEMDGAIAMAELMSTFICEQCGHPGKIRPGGYILTLCDEHAKK